MKFSTQEEYGLRCLIQVARNEENTGVTISEISRRENLTTHHVAKLLRILRQAGFVSSERGHTGGYALARPADQIVIGNVLAALGGKLFEDDFCERHSGVSDICTHSIDCAIISLWQMVQSSVDKVLGKTTLQDLMGTTQNFAPALQKASEITLDVKP